MHHHGTQADATCKIGVRPLYNRVYDNARNLARKAGCVRRIRPYAIMDVDRSNREGDGDINILQVATSRHMASRSYFHAIIGLQQKGFETFVCGLECPRMPFLPHDNALIDSLPAGYVQVACTGMPVLLCGVYIPLHVVLEVLSAASEVFVVSSDDVCIELRQQMLRRGELSLKLHIVSVRMPFAELETAVPLQWAAFGDMYHAALRSEFGKQTGNTLGRERAGTDADEALCAAVTALAHRAHVALPAYLSLRRHEFARGTLSLTDLVQRVRTRRMPQAEK